MESIDNIVIKIELDKLVNKGLELTPYWSQGEIIFEALKRQNWIDEKGDVLVHFKMSEVRCTPKPNGKYEVVFDYHLVK